MPSASSKRVRRSGSDRGRASPPQDSVYSAGSEEASLALLASFKDNVINMVLADLQSEAASGGGNGLPCPFQRRNPRRYRLVKDPACNGRGFKDIADLRDHIKRAHSSKYGCHYCKDRFQGRDNTVEDAAKQHRKKCKLYTNGRVAEVSQNKPEVMSPDQDKRYFQLDFRRAKGYSPEDKQCAQYWDICKAIWPEYASPEAFEQLDLRNKAGAIDVSRLSEIMENAMEQVDLSQFAMSTSRSVSQYASSSSRGSYQDSPRSSFAASSPQSPSRAFQSSSQSPDAAAADYEYDNGNDQDQQQQAPQYGELNSLYAVPQPVRYADSSSGGGRHARDSAYGSSQTDEAARNCWQYGNVALGDQMLTDPDPYGAGGLAVVDRDIQLSGISAGDIAGIVSPGYQCYGAGLEDDDLMMGGAPNGEDDGFYMT